MKIYILAIAAAFLPVGQTRAAESRPQSYQFFSPNRKIQVGFEIGSVPQGKGTPFYKVEFENQELIENSALGLEFAGKPLHDFSIQRVKHRSHDSVYSLPIGKARQARDHFEEYEVDLLEHGALGKQLSIIFRLFDDGVGFRYEIPAQKGLSEFVITDEKTSFRLKNNPQVFAVELPIPSSFEGYYKSQKLKEIKAGNTMNVPVLTGQASGLWLAITEAGLLDYAGMNLVRSRENILETRLTSSLKDPSVKVRAKAPFHSPWRVLMIGKSAPELLESNIVNNLNEPTAIADTSWIHPGKVQFPWWNNYELPVDPNDQDPAHQPGLNTWSLKRYIDFCAANGIEYHSLDGFDQAWYGGEIFSPRAGVDLTKTIPQIDLPEVLRYGREKGVRMRIWMHRKPLERADMDLVFSTYQKWGIEGVMVDFLDGDDQESVRFYTRVIRSAAKHHLTVNFHGVWKPTGVSRTYPNLLSQEGVLSSEYNRFEKAGSPPEHEMMYAFVRQLAGPLDVHPGSFRPIAAEDWTMESAPLRAMGTLARELAIYVVMESGAQMLVDAPAAYLAQPQAFEFVKQVPVAWDETKALAGEVGHYISMARRSGKGWYIGSMTDRQARHLELPLSFLGDGEFKAEIYADGPGTRAEPTNIINSQSTVTARDTLKVDLAASGGNAVRIYPLHEQ